VTTSIRPLFLMIALIDFGVSTLPGTSPSQPLSQSPQLTPTDTVAGEDSMRGMDSMPGMSDMNHAMSSSGHEWCQDVAWSTFNHRVSGWFLLLWGLTALIAGLQWPRRTWWRFVPPIILFGFAEFLFFRNDPEAFPVGPMSFWASLRDPEDLQHRIFLLLVILLALVELLRAANRLPRLLAEYALPALGTFGAIYLFFHKHGGAAMGTMMHHMQESSMAADPGMHRMLLSMSLIRHEHMWFSIFGFALVTCKLLADTGRLKGRWGASLWCVFAIVLGAYMTGYVE
jgi:hypothetical protein